MTIELNIKIFNGCYLEISWMATDPVTEGYLCELAQRVEGILGRLGICAVVEAER